MPTGFDVKYIVSKVNLSGFRHRTISQGNRIVCQQILAVLFIRIINQFVTSICASGSVSHFFAWIGHFTLLITAVFVDTKLCAIY